MTAYVWAISPYESIPPKVIYAVEKHDDAKRNYFSSNRWDAPADIMMTEYRLEMLQEYSREKRAYTKQDSAYWHEGGIEALRLNVEKQYKGQQSLKIFNHLQDFFTSSCFQEQWYRPHPDNATNQQLEIFNPFLPRIQTNPVNLHQLNVQADITSLCLSVVYAPNGPKGGTQACQTLTSSGLAPDNNTTWNLLVSKHPKGIPPTPRTAPLLAAPYLPPDFNIMAILHSFPKDTACGPSGLRIQHLIEAAEVPIQFPICAVLREGARFRYKWLGSLQGATWWRWKRTNPTAHPTSGLLQLERLFGVWLGNAYVP
eukprot:Em0001g496a